MAKKDKKDLDKNKQEGEESSGSKLVTMLIVLIIVAIWLAVFAVLIKLDVGSFGSEILSPLLKDVPVINKILPDSAVESADSYEYSSMEEAVNRIKELERQLATTSDTGKANDDTIKNLQAEVARLKVFEKNQADFAEREKQFNEKVVFNDKAPEIAEYRAFYEGINPENAEEIYKRVIEQQQYNQTIQNSADRFSSMEPENAAAVIETMTGDLDLLAAIFDCMSESESGAIFDNLSPNAVAQITTRMTKR